MSADYSLSIDSSLRPTRSCRLGRRSKRGSLLIELSCGSFFFTLFAVLAMHMCVSMYGAFFNDQACRDAARAAAQGENITQATRQAQAVLKSHQINNGYLSSPVLKLPIVYNDFGGSPPPQTSPYVQLTTSTTVTPPFQAMTFFNAGLLQDGKIVFTQTYTFPIVRTH